MSSYLSLEESAKLLGLTTNEIIEMRSRGEIFGFRDGTSWKFKSDEIERVQRELSGDVLDDNAGGSSILLSERPGDSSKSGILPGGVAASSSSDLQLDADAPDFGSDVSLIPDPSSGSGLRLVNRNAPAPADGDDDVFSLADDDSGELEIDASSLSLGPSSILGSSSDLGLGSDLRLADEVSDSPPAKPTPAKPAAKPDVIGDDDLDLGGELQLASDDDDDLVLGGNNELGMSVDSGINLTAPSDSGLSLEDDALEIDGSNISGLNLGSDIGGGSDIPGGGSGAGLSNVDFSAAEDFQLSPSDGMEIEEDSGSQVIEIEDSTDLGGGFGGDDLGMPAADGGFMEGGFDEAAVASGAAASAGAYRGALDVPLAFWQVGTLLLILMILGLSGLMVTDIVRNMWSWNGESEVSITSWFTRMIINAVGMQT
jgi:hypothetical protein